ncbi:hypothetical protein TSAR_008726 [Trichomalopsis sarcophagae]|uniref:Uncharacterized protein n=1 Tax=Trichomalopsis sarcophagae TaxID=543379 RepID=A0A232F950_9HYME|nr:hypothetical protein TSAR_008726 [Trichomalopsis sarcophagae]
MVVAMPADYDDQQQQENLDLARRYTPRRVVGLLRSHVFSIPQNDSCDFPFKKL